MKLYNDITAGGWRRGKREKGNSVRINYDTSCADVIMLLRKSAKKARTVNFYYTLWKEQFCEHRHPFLAKLSAIFTAS